MDVYRIELRGFVQLDELNPHSPQHMHLLENSPAATLISICTDQAGLIGQLRWLHNLGLVVRSIQLRDDERKETSHAR